jgi:hypothetical protein
VILSGLSGLSPMMQHDVDRNRGSICSFSPFPAAFAAFQLRKMAPDEIAAHLATPEEALRLDAFLTAFLKHIWAEPPGGPAA